MKTLALIGLGRWGHNYLKPYESSHFLIKYICSLHINVKSFNRNKFVGVENFKELLKKTDIDGVIISTPSDTHFEIAYFFLNNGFNVLIEKPIAKTTSEVKKIYSLANSKSKSVLTNYPYLYNPAFIKFQEEIKKIGKITNIEIKLGNKDEENKNALWEWGPHVFAVIYSIIKKKPASLDISKNKNIISFKMSFQNGILIDSTIGFGLEENMRVFICKGEKGEVVYNELARNKVYLKTDFGEKNLNYPKESALENLLTSFCLSMDSKTKNEYFGLDNYVTNLLGKVEKLIKINNL